MRASERPLAIRELLAEAAREAIEHGRPRDAARWFGQLAAETLDETARALALADCALATASFDPDAAHTSSARAINQIDALLGNDDGARTNNYAGAPTLAPLERARLLEASARLLVTKHRERSIRRAREAERIYQSAGDEERRAALTAWLERIARPRGRPKSPGVLTEREQEVVALVAEACTDKEIAARLFLSESTVRKHVENAKRKLNVSRRIEILTRLQRI
jgi:DNA-binding CsgD family transcriptional regulator